MSTDQKEQRGLTNTLLSLNNTHSWRDKGKDDQTMQPFSNSINSMIMTFSVWAVIPGQLLESVRAAFSVSAKKWKIWWIEKRKIWQLFKSMCQLLIFT